MTERKRGPRTPLLMVMLLATALVAAAVWAIAHVELDLRVVEPIVVTAMVVAGGATRAWVR